MRWVKVHANARAKETPEGKKVAGRKGGVWGPGRRWGHTCNAVRGGRLLYVFGGYGEDNCQTNDVHVFDTVKQTWSKPMMKGVSPLPRDSHTCTTVGSKLFVFGGTDGKNPLKDLYVLDTSNNTWIVPVICGKGPDAREGHGAALVGTRLFIFGGCGKSKNNFEEVYFEDLYILDTEKFIWEVAVTSGTPPSARDSHACSSWGNKLIVLGGEDASDYYLSDVYMLDTDTMVWKELNTSGQMLAPRAGHCTVALGRNLLVFGGFTDHRILYDDLHVLNMGTGIWKRVTSVNPGPSARFSAAGDCVDPQSGTLVLIGGCNGSLEALDDMYYLHTDIKAGNEEADVRREKLSFRKELKRKCQESTYENDFNAHKLGMISDSSQTAFCRHENDYNVHKVGMTSGSSQTAICRYENDYNVHKIGMTSGSSQTAICRYETDYNVHKIGMTSDSSQTGRFICNSNPREEKTFQARVVDRISNGYTVETSINGQLLRGVLFSSNPNFNNGGHYHINKNKKRMGLESDARLSDEHQQRLKTAKATHQAIQNAHEGVIDHVHTGELTTVQSHRETLGLNLINMVPADVVAQPERGLEPDPSSVQEVPLRDEHDVCPNGPTREVAYKINPSAAEETLAKLPSKEPAPEGNGNLINVQ